MHTYIYFLIISFSLCNKKKTNFDKSQKFIDSCNSKKEKPNKHFFTSKTHNWQFLDKHIFLINKEIPIPSSDVQVPWHWFEYLC